MSPAFTRGGLFAALCHALFLIALAAPPWSQPRADEQDDPPGRVARLSFLRGPVSFQPAGEAEWVGATPNRPLTTGDRLWTDAGARAELDTGSITVRLDGSADLAFLNLDDRILQLQLTQGTVAIRVQRLHRDELVEVDTPNQAFTIQEPGSYRIEAGGDGAFTVVTVRAGVGEASGGGETFTIRAGQATRFTGTDALHAALVGSGRVDEFEAWGQGRDRRAEASLSARYVSHEVAGYEDLDDNGTWSEDPSYGAVWVPTHVSSGWAPYHDGHWAWIAPWGYTWVDDAPWGYAPFHYGRWVTYHGRWGWVPGPTTVEPVYAPALVAFIGGPGFGLSLTVGVGPREEVGWFPLGPREVYVPGYHASRGYVERVNVSNTTVNNTTITNVYNTQVNNTYQTTNVQYVNRTARGGVTIVPQQAFRSAQPVARAAMPVNEQRLAAAPIAPIAAAAPARSSVFGGAKTEGAPRPPAAAAGRPVVAKTAPPPPPVPFAQQERALEAHPGQPLARHEVETVRPAAAVAPRPQVRLAPPGKPATAHEQLGTGSAGPGPQTAEHAAQAPVAPNAATPPQPASAKAAKSTVPPLAPRTPTPAARTPDAPKAVVQPPRQPGPQNTDHAASRPPDAPKAAAPQPPASAKAGKRIEPAPAARTANPAARTPDAPKAVGQPPRQPGPQNPEHAASRPPDAPKAAAPQPSDHAAQRTVEASRQPTHPKSQDEKSRP